MTSTTETKWDINGGYFFVRIAGQWTRILLVKSDHVTATFWVHPTYDISYDTGVQDYTDARRIAETIWRLTK